MYVRLSSLTRVRTAFPLAGAGRVSMALRPSCQPERLTYGRRVRDRYGGGGMDAPAIIAAIVVVVVLVVVARVLAPWRPDGRETTTSTIASMISHGIGSAQVSPPKVSHTPTLPYVAVSDLPTMTTHPAGRGAGPIRRGRNGCTRDHCCHRRRGRTRGRRSGVGAMASGRPRNDHEYDREYDFPRDWLGSGFPA